MANANDLFDKGEDVTSLFEKGEALPQPANEYSMLGAGAMGAVKGGTLGFDDEIISMAAAITKKIGGNEQSFWDIYRNIRDSVRKEHELAEAQQPTASFIGELGGGLVLPGGLVGKGATKGASFLQKMGAMTKTGAKAGAIAGLGTSKEDLTKGESDKYFEAAKDVAGSALLGAGVGAGMQATGSALKSVGGWAKNVTKQFPFAADTIEVFKRTKGGEELLGKVNEFSQENRNLARNIIDDLENLRRFMGSNKGAKLKEIDQSGIKIEIGGLVDDMQAKLANMKSAEPTEQLDIDKFRQVLSNIVKDETKDVISYRAKSKPPGLSVEDKAVSKIAKKTAEAEARDAIKIAELEDELARLAERGADQEEISPLVGKLQRLRGATEYPPQEIVEPLTGLDVKGVARGLNKAPIVEAVPQASEASFTPIEKIINQVSTRGRSEATPSEIDQIIRSLGSTYEKAETHVGRGLAQDVRGQLRQKLTEAIEQSQDPKVKAALQGLKDSIEQVKGVATVQEQLGLPKYFQSLPGGEGKKVEAINRLQRAIQETQKPGSQGKQVVDEALSQLEKVEPGMAKMLRDEIMGSSRKEYLAREIAKESALSKDPTTLYASGKSLALLTAQAAGKGTRKVAQAMSGPKTIGKKLVDLGKTVYNASPEVLQQMAESAVGKSAQIAATLNKVAAHGDQAKRRALLFTLMQQPEFREIAEGFFSDEKRIEP